MEQVLPGFLAGIIVTQLYFYLSDKHYARIAREKDEKFNEMVEEYEKRQMNNEVAQEKREEESNS